MLSLPKWFILEFFSQKMNTYVFIFYLIYLRHLYRQKYQIPNNQHDELQLSMVLGLLVFQSYVREVKESEINPIVILIIC